MGDGATADLGRREGRVERTSWVSPLRTAQVGALLQRGRARCGGGSAPGPTTSSSGTARAIENLPGRLATRQRTARTGHGRGPLALYPS